MLFVVGVSLQHVILRDQTLRAFGEEYLVAELDGRLHLAALDQVRMGFENGIDFLGGRNLLTIEHPTARLVNDAAAQTAEMLDLRSCAVDHLVGNADELAICAGLLLLPLLRGHPLDFLHPTPRRTPTISEAPDTPPYSLAEAADQARDYPHDIPQQRVVGRVMDVRLHHRGVDPQLLAILQPEIDRRLYHQLIDGLERLWRQSIEAAVERIVSRHRLRVEVRELAQRDSVSDPFAQLPIVPVLDTHENQRAQNLLRCQSAATSLRVLQASFQIASNLVDHFLMVVQKIGDRLQMRLQPHALPHQLQIGKADLALRCPRHRSALVALRRSRALPLQRLDISRCSLMQHILQSTPVVQTALHLRHKLFRNVNGNTTPLRATVQDITLMLLARQTSRAVLADAPSAPQAQRSKNRRPKTCRFILQPVQDVGG